MADVPQGYLCCKSLLCANVTPGFPVHQRRQGEASRMECEKMEKESGRVEKTSEGGCHAEKASHSCVKPNQAQSASLWRNVPTDCVFSIYLKLKLLHAHCCIPLSSALKASSGVDEKLIHESRVLQMCTQAQTSAQTAAKEWLQCSYIYAFFYFMLTGI